MDDAHKLLKTNPNRSVETFEFVHHATNGLNHGPVRKTRRQYWLRGAQKIAICFRLVLHINTFFYIAMMCRDTLVLPNRRSNLNHYGQRIPSNLFESFRAKSRTSVLRVFEMSSQLFLCVALSWVEDLWTIIACPVSKMSWRWNRDHPAKLLTQSPSLSSVYRDWLSTSSLQPVQIEKWFHNICIVLNLKTFAHSWRSQNIVKIVWVLNSAIPITWKMGRMEEMKRVDKIHRHSKKRRDQWVERQRTIRHVMTCGEHVSANTFWVILSHANADDQKTSASMCEKLACECSVHIRRQLQWIFINCKRNQLYWQKVEQTKLLAHFQLHPDVHHDEELGDEKNIAILCFGQIECWRSNIERKLFVHVVYVFCWCRWMDFSTILLIRHVSHFSSWHDSAIGSNLHKFIFACVDQNKITFFVFSPFLLIEFVWSFFQMFITFFALFSDHQITSCGSQ